MEYNIDICEDEYAMIAEAAEIDIHKKTKRESAEMAIYAVKRLTEDIGLPTRLSDVNVSKRACMPAQRMQWQTRQLYNPRTPSGLMRS